ncbi:DUF368 domain-containing protein [Marinigracilibium pacificum]|uniref:DUF368 domain-containing protein n=1 Tax=Marinigracilibium pacificum TaxID=2729599 RepID=A0A848IVX0_9BACT|nr:DUF368 domain-containing protein [Marinigracilibium pacificum]NMM47391.1 DUF368 domain-containing protein [Marinigracilibium pacificum]
MKSLKESFILFLKGLGMGSADVVPGVSGGTIAFITGIYDQLLESINSLNGDAFRLILKGDFKGFWDHVNGGFLLPLFIGIGASIFTFANFIEHWLEVYPIYVWSFFFGLIIVSAYLVWKNLKSKSAGVYIAFVIGVIVAYLITTFTPATTPESYWFVFLSGCIAICAMILPGISGSFILLILGKYIFIMDSIKSLKLDIIAVFGLGCIIGITSFSRVVSWCLDKYHDITVGVLAGFMIGSLNKVWPWKRVEDFMLNAKGEEVVLKETNLSPMTYQQEIGDPQLGYAILFMIIAVLFVLGLEKLADHLNKNEQ